jgi:ABC-2 type transport system permease protein
VTGPTTGRTGGLDLRPAPGSAPLRRQVLAQAAMESRLMLRNGEQLLLALVIPVLVLVGGVRAAERFDLGLDHPPIDVLAPGVLALAVMSTSFTSVAIATGFERRYGLIKRLGASPLPRHGLLLGKVGAVLLVQLLQLVVLAAVAVAMGWRPETGAWWAALLLLLLGTAAFTSLGLLVAGTLRAEATLAAANLIYLLLMTGGAVVLPASTYGNLGDVAVWLPSGALGEGMRSALLDGHADVSAMLVLMAWAALGTIATARTFKWE